MARRAKIQFGNLPLQRALKKYGDDVLERIQEIITETAMIIYNNAVSMAPEADGNLRQSISFQISPDGLTAQVEVGAHYAIYVEFGTGIYAVDGDGRKTPWVYWSDKLGRYVYTRGMEAQPFWFPAIDKGRNYFRREMRKLG